MKVLVPLMVVLPILGGGLSLALWRLTLASELVFSGDAGDTEASRPLRMTMDPRSITLPLPTMIRAFVITRS